jgi:hypothetical protein
MNVFLHNFRGAGSVQYFKSLALDWMENKNNLKPNTANNSSAVFLYRKNEPRQSRCL